MTSQAGCFVLTVWAGLFLFIATSASATESCQTGWFDDGDVSTEGDSELVQDLKRKHTDSICSNPTHMEVQTTAGIRAQHTKNTFHKLHVSEGVVCLNEEQTKGSCEDYKVMFTCSGSFCSGCRTRWFDSDDATGNGDFEILSMLRSTYPREICPQPIAIEAQTLSGQSASSTEDVFLVYDATYGFACVNADQGSGTCKDYRVRFTCPSDFCSVSEECRTRWLSSDDASDEGDVESLPKLLQMFPGQVCRNPIRLEAQTLYGISAKHTGDSFLSYDVTFGFVCINSEQKKGTCNDYQVMLTCPSDFCQGCRTRWFDLDDPTGRGDYETLQQLKVAFPDAVCSQPVAIEAMTTSGVPALQTDDTFQVYDATHGFACVNAEQGSRRCQDYKVRFTCPLDFCS